MSTDKLTHSFLLFKKALAKIVGEIVKDPVEVEDIIQEAYIKSFEASKSAEIKSPKAFLARTARNLAINHISRAAVKYNISLQENDDSSVYSNEPAIEQQVETQKRFQQFCYAVQSLPVQCRRVFVLKQVYGMSQKEIAARLNISEKTVEYHVAKGLLKCKKYLDSQESQSSIVDLKTKNNA